MKKILFLILVFLMLCTSLTAFASDNKYDNIKVGLYYSTTALNTVTLEASGGMSYGTYDEEFHPEGEWTEQSIVISAAGKNLLSVNGQSNIDITGKSFAVYPKSGFIYVNGSAYRGGVILKTESNDKMTVINCLKLEEYLYGVIGSEMPSSWSIEALKAQAVCARSFAVTNWNKHSESGFNVCASTNCQVYSGVAAETDSTVKAVNETAGKLLMYKNQVAQTVFFSCSGGHTADVRHVWGGDVEYLRGVEDPYEDPETTPRHTWSATLTNEDIKNALQKIGVDIGDIKSISAVTDESEHVYELNIKGSTGEYTLKNLDVCSVFAQYGVQSHKYTVTPYGGNTSSLYALSGSEKASLVPKYVLSGAGKKYELTAAPTLLSSQGKTTPQSGTPSGYVFNGGGWGHGVGMSQYGAKGMAENGFTYDKILYHYYPGTYLE